jgi:hypothetical protein
VGGELTVSGLPMATVASNLVTYDKTTGKFFDSAGLFSNKLAVVSVQPPEALTRTSTVVTGHGTYTVESPGVDAYKLFDKDDSTTWTGDNVTVTLPYKTTLRYLKMLADTLSGTVTVEASHTDGLTWTTLVSGATTAETVLVNATQPYKKYKFSFGSSITLKTLDLFTESFSIDGGKIEMSGPSVVNSSVDINGTLKTNGVDEVPESLQIPLNIDTDIIGTWLNADNPGNIETDAYDKVTKVWDETSLLNNFEVPAARGVTYNTSKRMIYFDGTTASTNHMEASLPSSVTTTSSSYCFTIVVETDNTFTSTQLFANLFNSANDAGVSNRRHNLFTTNTNTGRGAVADQINDNLINRDRTMTKQIMTLNVDGTTASLYVNGMFAGSSTLITSVRNEAVVRLGSDGDSNNTYTLKAWIGEAIFFTRNLSEPELINLHGYLNTKWSIYTQPVFDIFTAAGQSNMSGRAGDANATVKPDYGREFDPQYWTTATKTPLKLIRDPVGATDTIDTGGTGSCLPAFCEEYYKQTGRECVILYCAKGGSSIFNSTEWDLDYKDTNYVGKSVDILNQAVTKLTNMGYKVNNKSLLWHQGESDQSQTTAIYKAKFLQLYDYWVSNGYDNVFYYEISRTAANEFVNPRAAQREMWKDRMNLHLIFSCYKFYAQLKFSDNIHYSPEGYDEMGREGAKSVAKVLGATRNSTIQKVLDIVPGGTSSTAGIKLPNGTSNQRPTNAQNGILRYNTDANEIEILKNNTWSFIDSENGLSLASAAPSASVIRNVLGANAVDGLYYLKLPGMSSPEQFYIYFNKEFASEGVHHYVVLSTFGPSSGNFFTTGNWTNSGTVSTSLNTLYSRLYLLDTIFPTSSDSKYYIYLQNKLEITGNPWIEWVSSQTHNPYDSKSSAADVSGKVQIYRTSGINGWGTFGGYHNQSATYASSGGKIVGSAPLGNWYWDAATTGIWNDGIPVASGSPVYTYNGSTYDLTSGTSASLHNIFAVAN